MVRQCEISGGRRKFKFSEVNFGEVKNKKSERKLRKKK